MQRRQNGTLSQAITLLVQNQAAFVAQLAEANKERAELQRQTIELERQMDLRMTRIEKTMEEIKAILVRHQRILEQLPDALQQKIGFKRPRA